MATFRSQGKKKGLFRIQKTSLFIPSPIRYNDSIPTKRERLMDHVSQQTDTELLLQWYDARRRILPWREDPTPYHVWISEIMLQQTRVDAVIPYYERFLAALPDVKALAEADEEVCLKLWEGLGYYSRVRNMHKAARQIMEEYDGQIPGTSAQLQKLSGIGRYTSEAIASIAFGEAVPSVDGNLLRVFARRTEYEGNIKSPQALRDAVFPMESLCAKSVPGTVSVRHILPERNYAIPWFRRKKPVRSVSIPLFFSGMAIWSFWNSVRRTDCSRDFPVFPCWTAIGRKRNWLP